MLDNFVLRSWKGTQNHKIIVRPGLEFGLLG
jgi:hypothetical protein